MLCIIEDGSDRGCKAVVSSKKSTLEEYNTVFASIGNGFQETWFHVNSSGKTCHRK